MLSAVIATATIIRLIQLPEGPGPLNNPLKGYAATDRWQGNFGPVSMTFIYASWRELEPVQGQFDFEKWEAKRWNTKNSRGKRLVIRVYLDWPNRTTAVPDWIESQGVQLRAYDRGPKGHSAIGVTPDYENPILQQGMVRLITALGKRYDTNPRIAFFQLGMLGHYGEWHTYPNYQLFASRATQDLVVQAYQRAFPNVKLMARYGYLSSVQKPWMGFHDDMIPEDTLPDKDWHFMTGLKQGGMENNWKVAPIGGEMVPGQAVKWLGEGWHRTKQAVTQGHFTWIGGYSPAIESSDDAVFVARREELISLLGYEFRWLSAEIPDSASREKPLKFSLNGINQGVAPFYYPWKLRFALLDANGAVAMKWNSSADIRKWLPGEFRLDTTAPKLAPAGQYQVGIQIVDPATNQSGIKFANNLPVSAGYTLVGQVTVN